MFKKWFRTRVQHAIDLDLGVRGSIRKIVQEEFNLNTNNLQIIDSTKTRRPEPQVKVFSTYELAQRWGLDSISETEEIINFAGFWNYPRFRYAGLGKKPIDPNGPTLPRVEAFEAKLIKTNRDDMIHKQITKVLKKAKETK